VDSSTKGSALHATPWRAGANENRSTAVSRTALFVLGCGRGHDEIIIAGRVRDRLAASPQPDALPMSPWTPASHFLAEAAARPLESAAVIAYLAQRIDLDVDREEVGRRPASVQIMVSGPRRRSSS
jgi:hypothetical protein